MPMIIAVWVQIGIEWDEHQELYPPKTLTGMDVSQTTSRTGCRMTRHVAYRLCLPILKVYYYHYLLAQCNRHRQQEILSDMQAAPLRYAWECGQCKWAWIYMCYECPLHQRLKRMIFQVIYDLLPPTAITWRVDAAIHGKKSSLIYL